LVFSSNPFVLPCIFSLFFFMDSILVIGNKIDVCHLQVSQALPHLLFYLFSVFSSRRRLVWG
jgi:hypothetical protein